MTTQGHFTTTLMGLFHFCSWQWWMLNTALGVTGGKGMRPFHLVETSIAYSKTNTLWKVQTTGCKRQEWFWRTPLVFLKLNMYRTVTGIRAANMDTFVKATCVLHNLEQDSRMTIPFTTNGKAAGLQKVIHLGNNSTSMTQRNFLLALLLTAHCVASFCVWVCTLPVPQDSNIFSDSGSISTGSSLSGLPHTGVMPDCPDMVLFPLRSGLPQPPPNHITGSCLSSRKKVKKPLTRL